MLTMTETIAEPYDPLLPQIALQRWESDGGAPLPAEVTPVGLKTRRIITVPNAAR